MKPPYRYKFVRKMSVSKARTQIRSFSDMLVVCFVNAIVSDNRNFTLKTWPFLALSAISNGFFSFHSAANLHKFPLLSFSLPFIHMTNGCM